MNIDISQIKNTYLHDIAKIADKNGDGFINNETEASIFLEKSKNLINKGLCTEAECSEVLSFSPNRTSGQKDENEISKTKKTLSIEIKKQEAKIEQLKAQNPEEKFDNRKIYSTVAGIIPTGLAGAALGFKIGSAFGPAGMVVGALVGNTIGAIVGGFTGKAIADATISKDDLKEAQKQINDEIEIETKKLEELKKQYEELK